MGACIRFLCALGALFVGMLSAQGAVAQTVDRDCANFAFQEDAQAFFEAAGAGDPHNLDADNDGIACETLPRRATGPAAPRSAGEPRTPRTPGQPRTPGEPRTPRTPRVPGTGTTADVDCIDFDTQAEAQAFFRAQGAGDPHDLDADNDGIACETLPRATGTPTLPQTGSRAALFGAAGLTLLLVGVALVGMARRAHAPMVQPQVIPPRDDWDGRPLIGW